jgi:hypothetical protein
VKSSFPSVSLMRGLVYPLEIHFMYSSEMIRGIRSGVNRGATGVMSDL